MIFTRQGIFLPGILLLLSTLVAATYNKSWDLAAVVGDDIIFLSRDRAFLGRTNVEDAIALTGLAYDESTGTMFLSDIKSGSAFIFGKNLTEKNVKSTPLTTNINYMHIIAIVFDEPSRTLFWVDNLKEVIMKMHVPVEGEPGEPVVLHDLVGGSPHGIVLDVCNSHVYWSKVWDPSIERSNFDGSERKVIIKKNVRRPTGLAIDHMEQKIYWIDNEDWLRFKIERSNLDGSERELIFSSKYQQPFHIAVDNESIYWTDSMHRLIWTIPKDVSDTKVSAVKIKSYHPFERYSPKRPAGIICRNSISCLKQSQQTNLSTSASQKNSTERFDNLSLTNSSFEELQLIIKNISIMKNELKKMDNTCQCKPKLKVIEDKIEEALTRFQKDVLLVVFQVFSFLLLLTNVGLSYYVKKLRKQLQDKEDFMIRENIILSRPGENTEIVIEKLRNRYNMNIYEIPLFISKQRQKTPANSEKKKDEI